MILGIEFGSTNIKAVLIDNKGNMLLSSSYGWVDNLVDGYWSYSLDEAIVGMQTCFEKIKAEYEQKHKENFTIDALGVSAMMHGYLAFDKNDNLLVPYRTWRNTTTSKAVSILSKELNFNMPERWSVSHYYQAILNKEKHIKDISYLTTLAGYIHYKLTGKKELGIGDCSGMFPIKNKQYDKDRLVTFNNLLEKQNINVNFEDLLPSIMLAGESSTLTKEGAKLLDKTGTLQAGIKVCAPEGDAGTGMVATNSVKVNTGNISCGTSAFSMVVMDKELSKPYKQIDMVTTPCGEPVSMIHSNNCTSEINMWVNMLKDVLNLFSSNVDNTQLFNTLFNTAKDADMNLGNIACYNFFSGEPVVSVESGMPMLLRENPRGLTLPNFIASQIYSAIAPIYIGNEILKKENVVVNNMCAHGGFVKSVETRKAISLAVNSPITTYKSASEGGAYGISLLALFATKQNVTLYDFLDSVFEKSEIEVTMYDEKDKIKFNNFINNYKKYLFLQSNKGEKNA